MMNKISIALPEDRQEIKRLLGISGPGRPDSANRPEVTLQDIADQAKCSIGSVVLYFNNEEPKTSIPDRIQKAIVKLINEKPVLLRRLLDMQESAARVERTKR